MNTEMMDKISEIIGGLCEQLGTTVQYLIPEMAKMHIANSTFWTIGWAAIFLTCIIFLPVTYKLKKENEWSNTFTFAFVVNVVMLVLSLIFGLCCASDLVKWNASPTAMAISTLMNKVLLLKD